MLPQRLCIIIAKVVYLDAISTTRHELFYKHLYVYKWYILVRRIVRNRLSLFFSNLEVMIPNNPSDRHAM